MIRTFLSIAFFGALLVLINERFIALAAGLFIIGFCVLWVWAAKDDEDVRSMAEFKAEKQARLDAEMAELNRRGMPWRG